MSRKLWKKALCCGLVCLVLMATAAVAQPVDASLECGGVIAPFDIQVDEPKPK